MPLEIKIFLFGYVIVYLYVDIPILIWLKEENVLDVSPSDSQVSRGKLTRTRCGFTFQ